MKHAPALAAVLALLLTAACATASPRPTVTAYAGAEDVSCRPLLSGGSNAIRMVCGTDEQWARYDRRMAQASYVFVHRLQGSQY
jgi:hypothetical protein